MQQQETRGVVGHCMKFTGLTFVNFKIGRGDFIVVLDSEDRENEGDLIIAAEDMTEAKMAFMIRYSR